MRRATQVFITWWLVLAGAGCTRDKPAADPALKMIPDSYSLVAVVDGAAVRKLYRLVYGELKSRLPEEMAGKVPAWDALAGLVREHAGIDLDKVPRLVVAADFGNFDKGFVVLWGQPIEAVKGEKSGELVRIKDAVVAPLDANCIVFATSEKELKHVRAAWAGKASRRVESDEVFRALVAQDEKLSQLRLYFASSFLPPHLRKPPIGIQAVALLLHLERGISMIVHADEDTVGNVKTMIEMAVMQTKKKAGQLVGQELPAEAAGQVEKVMVDFLKNLKISREGPIVRVVHQTDPAELVGALVAVGLPSFLGYIEKSKTEQRGCLTSPLQKVKSPDNLGR